MQKTVLRSLLLSFAGVVLTAGAIHAQMSLQFPSSGGMGWTTQSRSGYTRSGTPLFPGGGAGAGAMRGGYGVMQPNAQQMQGGRGSGRQQGGQQGAQGQHLSPLPSLMPGEAYVPTPEMSFQQGGAVGSSMVTTLPATLLQPAPRAGGEIDPRPEWVKEADKERERKRMMLPPPVAPQTLKGLPIHMPFGLALDEPLSLFGYDFFASGPQPPHETTLMSVPGDYRLGPGDLLSIHVWNKLADETILVEVNREGRISLPRAGEMLVLGLEYGTVGAYLKKELSRFLTEVSVSVVLARMRSFQVLVSGEVKQPGTVSLTAVNTALSALLAAGGPTSRGSLRRITLRRNGTLVRTLDYYDLLLKGDMKEDPRLQAGDLLFVPVIGSMAAATGMVKRPAVYELREGDTLASLVRYAGGLTPAAYPRRLVVYRTRESALREIRDIKAEGAWEKQAAKLALKDGDVLNVPAITTTVENGVTLRGNVERPGEYEWKEGMKLRDLVQMGRKVLPDTLMSRVEILRERQTPAKLDFNQGVQTQTVRELLTVDLAKAMAGEASDNLALRPKDDVKVLNVREGGPTPQVSLGGEVSKPGDYELASGMRVRDLIFMGGGITAQSHLARAELARRLPTGGRKVIPVDLSRAMAGDETQNPLLENYDLLAVHADPKLNEKVTVQLAGEVRFPGEYQMFRGDRLSGLLERAGGLTEQAFVEGLIYRRLSLRQRQEEQKKQFVEEQRKLIAAERSTATRLPEGARPEGDPKKLLGEAEELVARLERAPAEGRLRLHVASLEKLKGTDEDVGLEDGDALTIPRRPEEVTVSGEVFTAGAFLYRPSATVKSYLDLAGGLTARAWRQQIFVVRADGSALSATQTDSASANWDGLHLGRPSRSQNFLRTTVNRGDALFVPPDYRVRRDRSAEIIDRVYKIALSVGALSGVLR